MAARALSLVRVLTGRASPFLAACPAFVYMSLSGHEMPAADIFAGAQWQNKRLAHERWIYPDSPSLSLALSLSLSLSVCVSLAPAPLSFGSLTRLPLAADACTVGQRL